MHRKLLIQLSFFGRVCNAVFLTDAVGRSIVTKKSAVFHDVFKVLEYR